MAGALSAFFLGSYTGVLLSATNQPFWSDTTWLAPLFLASSASTGLAALILLARWRGRDVPEDAIERLEWADGWAVAMELILLVAFALSLGRLAGPAFSRWPGVLIPSFVVPVGLVLPMILKRIPKAWGGWASSLLILAGGFALRAAVVGMPVPGSGIISRPMRYLSPREMADGRMRARLGSPRKSIEAAPIRPRHLLPGRVQARRTLDIASDSSGEPDPGHRRMRQPRGRPGPRRGERRRRGQLRPQRRPCPEQD